MTDTQFISPTKFTEMDGCPDCGGCPVTIDEDWEDNLYTREMSCTKCGLRWTEIYTLTEINIKRPKEEL